MQNIKRLLASLKQLRNNSLVRDSLKLAASHFVMFFLPLIVTPILSRIYMPEHFGEWGVFSSTFYIISVILFLCYEYAIIKVEPEDYPNTVVLCFLVAFVIIASTIALFGIGIWLNIGFFVNFDYKLPLVVYLFVTSFTKIFNYITNRFEMYWVMSTEYFISGLSQAVFRMLFGFLLLFENGLIAGTIFSQILCCFFYLIFLLKFFNADFFKHITFDGIKRIATENKKFPLYDTPSTLLSYAALNLPIIILSVIFGKSEIGCFSIIVQLLLLPMSLIGSAIGRVYFQQISANNQDSNIQRISLNVLKLTIWLAILPTLFLSCGGDKLVEIFLGERWTTAGSISLCLALWSIPTILTQPLLPIFRNKNCQESMFRYDGVYFFLGIGFLSLACAIKMNLFSCILCYAIGCFVAKLILLCKIIKITDVKVSSFLNKPVYFTYLFCFVVLTIRLYKLSCQ